MTLWSLTAWLPRLDTLNELNACEEEEQHQEEECVPSSSSSHSHNAGPSYLHTPPSKNTIKSNTSKKCFTTFKGALCNFFTVSVNKQNDRALVARNSSLKELT